MEVDITDDKNRIVDGLWWMAEQQCSFGSADLKQPMELTFRGTMTDLKTAGFFQALLMIWFDQFNG